MTQRSADTPWLSGRWRPVATFDLAVPMPDRAVRWRGRTYDLANVDDLVELSAALAVEDDVQGIVSVLDAEAEAADAESDRLRAEIEANNLKTAALQAANDASGMTAAQEQAARWVNGEARADAIEWHRRQYGAPWQANSRPPQSRTLSSLPALPATEDNRADLVREHRRRAGF